VLYSKIHTEKRKREREILCPMIRKEIIGILSFGFVYLFSLYTWLILVIMKDKRERGLKSMIGKLLLSKKQVWSRLYIYWWGTWMFWTRTDLVYADSAIWKPGVGLLSLSKLDNLAIICYNLTVQCCKLVYSSICWIIVVFIPMINNYLFSCIKCRGIYRLFSFDSRILMKLK
jgi:hypothetical protein